MLALFIYTPRDNILTFAGLHHGSEQELSEYAHKKYHKNLHFAVYEWKDHEMVYDTLKCSVWELKYTFMGLDASGSMPFTAMRKAYNVDNGHCWFFKSF
jgi:hypothetical protein